MQEKRMDKNNFHDDTLLKVKIKRKYSVSPLSNLQVYIPMCTVAKWL